MKEKFTCSICGAILNEETVHEFDGQLLCEDCFDEHTAECDCCHDRIWLENAETDNYTTLCSTCYDDYYTTCTMCDRIISRDYARYEENGDDPYCEHCFSKLEETPIKPYSYKPEPIFYGSGNLFYCVELEIDKGGDYDENAEPLLNIANCGNEHMYCKRDGSIINGFEMVSHPMSLDYHINQMNRSKIFNRAVELGYRSHSTTTCGLHIHVSRSAFGKTHDEQEDAISRIVYFVEAHWNELLKFSRRTEMNIMRWASRYGIAENTKLTYDKAKKMWYWQIRCRQSRKLQYDRISHIPRYS